MPMAIAGALAVGMWWTANTVSHLFIHRPFDSRRRRSLRASPFDSRRVLNAACSLALTLVIAVPQTLWRQRHLAHHAGRPLRLRLTPQLAFESAALVALWVVLFAAAPRFFATVYLPGCAAALALCAIQGHYEHVHGTTSHYGWLYNALCFNDGYHAEHHARPGVPWRQLPALVDGTARTSVWPPLLRWLDDLPSAALGALERVVLRVPALQRFVVQVHRRAFARLLPPLPPRPRIAVVGGGLFPRTALVLRELIPDASLVVIDSNAAHLDRARQVLGDRVEYLHCMWGEPEPAPPARPRTGVAVVRPTYDAVVIPLAYCGDRQAVYEHPSAPVVLVHDWIWRRRGRTAVVSPFLLKRVNAVRA